MSSKYHDMHLFHITHIYKKLSKMLELKIGISLLRVDMQLPVGVRTANGSLVFTRPLQKNYSGTYRCEVQNTVGLRSQDVQIRIRGELIFLHQNQLVLAIGDE